MLTQDAVPAGPNLLDLTFVYDSTAKRVNFSASAGKNLFLLDSIDTTIANSFSISPLVTGTPDMDLPTGSVTMVASEASGIESLALSFPGVPAIQLAQRLGFSWPLSSALNITSPALQFVRSPKSFELGFYMDIPSIDVLGAKTYLNIASGPKFTLQVFGICCGGAGFMCACPLQSVVRCKVAQSSSQAP
jgi:hypothetical protein